MEHIRGLVMFANPVLFSLPLFLTIERRTMDGVS